jgi:hypothetical protein
MRSLFLNFGPKRRIGFALALLSASIIAPGLTAQDTPILSGGVGFFSNTDGGKTNYQMLASPLIAVPIGPSLLIEGRANVLESVTPASTGGYNTSHLFALTYMQADYLAGKHVTLVGGDFLTPFGTYNERLSPIWINNFQDVPLIYAIGTMGDGNGSGTGGMIRGNALSTAKVSVSYAAYFSANITNNQFDSQRAAGGQTSFYFPKTRLEVGASYGHRLEAARENDFGTHVWWEPTKIPLAIRSEYAHAPHSQGYWIEADYHLPEIHDAKWIGKLEPVTRIQQVFRNAPDPTDGLPPVNTQRADFGLNYHFTHEVRINTSYGRLFASNGNVNIWETGLVYRFLTPVWKGKK